MEAVRESLYHLYHEVNSTLLGCHWLNYLGAAVIGCTSLCIGTKLVWRPFKLYIIARILPGIDIRARGKWAVVTGATDGIGREYANLLAYRGLDIVLISRSETKLARVALEIQGKYEVQVQTIAVDFTTTNIYNKIERELEGLDIAILVNNVGIAHEHAAFLKVNDMMTKYQEIVNVNCMAMTKMCGIVLPRMIEKHEGIIVNISSITASGYVTLAAYSASKAYVSTLSRCLNRTYKRSGVIIQTLEPGMVKTNLLQSNNAANSPQASILLRIGSYLTTVSVESYVASAIKTIGWSDYCSGHLMHCVLRLVSCMTSQSYKDKLLLEAAVN